MEVDSTLEKIIPNCGEYILNMNVSIKNIKWNMRRKTCTKYEKRISNVDKLGYQITLQITIEGLESIVALPFFNCNFDETIISDIQIVNQFSILRVAT